MTISADPIRDPVGTVVDLVAAADAALDRLQGAGEPYAFSGKNTSHVAAERSRQRGYHRCEDEDLQPTQGCHCTALSDPSPGPMRRWQALAKAPAPKNAASVSASINKSDISQSTNQRNRALTGIFGLK